MPMYGKKWRRFGGRLTCSSSRDNFPRRKTGYDRIDFLLDDDNNRDNKAERRSKSCRKTNL